MPTDQASIEQCAHLVDYRELEWIGLSDGRRLAARLFIPKDAGNNPVPVILEYLPYRRRDGTRPRDEQMAYWFAANQYAYARVDISGSGDSDGLIEDEYVKREQDDALEIIAWLAQQTWCSGNVGMIGISWGGFNGLQVAARRPEALKAVISLCSTVDRYHDDVHYMGGCLLNDNLDWGSIFFTYGALPPDPQMVGQERWRDIWLERLQGLTLYPAKWMQHQCRDDFWKHGSIIEDYDAVTCPVLAVSGWADGYSNTVFRLVENLNAPCQGIVGPWGHKFPQQGVPGPAIGFLQACKRWWDRWLKDIDNGAQDDPAMRLYLQTWQTPSPHIATRNGRWLGFPSWPPADHATLSYIFYGRELREASDAEPTSAHRTISSPQTTGIGAGEWCAYGMGKIAPELPIDQREDDSGSLTFDGAPLTTPIKLVGRAVVRLRVAADRPQALVAVRLNDVHPDGRAARVSYGLLNLSHREGHDHSTPLQPQKFYDVTIALNEACHQFEAGHCLRVAVSTCYWPMVWPSPETVALTVDCTGSAIDLPVTTSDEAVVPVDFEPVTSAPPLKLTVLRPGSETRRIHHDVDTQNTEFHINRDDGLVRIDDIGTELEISKDKLYCINRNDPLTCDSKIATKFHYHRGDWDAKTQTSTHLRADATNFYLDGRIEAFDRGELIFERDFTHVIKRNGL